MMALNRTLGTVALIAALLAPAGGLASQSLRGSPWSVTVQQRTAQEHDFTFLNSATGVREFVENGYLVELPGNDNYTLGNVSYPYARAEVKLFVERLAAQYRAACGEPLVVTSLTRPRSAQPKNASRRSVHPTGMAVDVRRSTQRTCRSWLEDTLLSLEKQGVLEATRERYPPHYHIAVFPSPYVRYVASLPDPSLPVPTEVTHHEVRRGDSLWGIARNYGIELDMLKAANNITDNQIYAGQTLRIPSGDG